MISKGRWPSVAGSLLALAAIGLGTVPAGAAVLELKKNAGPYEIELRIDRNPPIVGDNGLELRIRDAAGVEIRDAKVLVNYYMPPMPRMAPMNYKAEAKLKKDAYGLRMRLIMAGPWIIVVKVTIGDKTTSARFQIDAR